MGLVLNFRGLPPPGVDVADDGLPAGMNVNVLDANGLFAAALQFVQQLDVTGEGIEKLCRHATGRVELRNLIGIFGPDQEIHPTPVHGVVTFEIEPHVDDRGFFARAYCPDEFAKAGIAFTSTQINLSRNARRHTLRGMHYQDAPLGEPKIVRAVRGRIYDVVADIRPSSPTYLKWTAVELDANRANGVFIPEGCAHGFLSLEDDCDVLYQMGRAYVPGMARGFRYDDPAFAISWPVTPAVVSDADEAWPAWNM